MAVPRKRKASQPAATMQSKISKLRDHVAELFGDVPKEDLPDSIRALIDYGGPSVSASVAPSLQKTPQNAKVCAELL